MNKNELIKQICFANELILREFYGRMKGVIANRYNKSKGFQFAMLDKNLQELMELIYTNNQLIKQL